MYGGFGQPRVNQPEPEYSPSTLIIFYDAGIGKEPLLKAIEDYHATVIYDLKIMKSITIKIPDGTNIEDAINYFLSMMVDLPQQNYPNVDNMTYEELLELEERIGKVSNGLTDEEIKKLKHEKFIKYKYLDDKCIICQYIFKELESIVVLPCKHCFHFSCLKPWISKEHHCPLCKKNIREEEK